MRGLQHLLGRSIDDLPSLGAKAAQLAELATVVSTRTGCLGPVNVPRDAAAIPIVHSLEHYEASGAAALLAHHQADPQFASDPRVRAAKLAELRDAIMQHPVAPVLLDEVEMHVAVTFGQRRVRFRSSSNVEDLQGFGGAGLYTSLSGALGDPDRTIEDAMRTVWASLYNARAFDERLTFHIDESSVAIGILIHEAFLSEETNGIAISRNIMDPIHSDIYYVNAQAGEASVANPAPAITSEQLIYRWGRTPTIIYYGQSNLPGGVPVLGTQEVDVAACTLRAIHDHFEPLLDPLGENRWFAMEIEFKHIGPLRDLLVKQARPYSFGKAQMPEDCREI